MMKDKLKTERKSLLLAPKFKEQVEKEAKHLGMSLNGFINHVLELYFRNFIKKDKK